MSIQKDSQQKLFIAIYVYGLPALRCQRDQRCHGLSSHASLATAMEMAK